VFLSSVIFGLQALSSPGTKPPLLFDHSGNFAYRHFENSWSNSANPMFQLEFAANAVIIPIHEVQISSEETWV
tara:strand:- start:3446 stop:3664 length:219 start_codon:yes stop_codon:yes gene_type:complete